MQYHVRGVASEAVTASMEMEELFPWIEAVVHPSLETLAKMAKDGKVSGGTEAGARVLNFVFDASSNEEAGQILRSLPMWGAVNWSLTPLQSFHSAVEQDRAAIARAKSMGAGKR